MSGISSTPSSGRPGASAGAGSSGGDGMPRRPRIRAARSSLRLGRLAERLVTIGMPPAWIGYRRVRKVPFETYVRDHDIPAKVIHAGEVVRNPLPVNVDHVEFLPSDRGWWGFSFRDVPARRSGSTIEACVGAAMVVPSEDDRGQFWASILDQKGTSIELREVSFRPWQASAIRRKRRRHIERATWIFERVYHNHSHWLTAHLPKILVLRQRGALDETLWPDVLPKGIQDCLGLFGIGFSHLPTFAKDELPMVDRLTLLQTDRFRPELLRLVRAQCPIPAPQHRDRRIYISRQGASRRRLLNEDAVWPRFAAAGFERVRMETLSFVEQVTLMREASAVAAPHGAGLTNVIFCEPGTDVIEIADLAFPNPNFYALSAAMGHRYWLVAAQGIGTGHPLQRDMTVEPTVISHVLDRLIQ